MLRTNLLIGLFSLLAIFTASFADVAGSGYCLSDYSDIGYAWAQGESGFSVTVEFYAPTDLPESERRARAIHAKSYAEGEVLDSDAEYAWMRNYVRSKCNELDFAGSVYLTMLSAPVDVFNVIGFIQAVRATAWISKSLNLTKTIIRYVWLEDGSRLAYTIRVTAEGVFRFLKTTEAVSTCAEAIDAGCSAFSLGVGAYSTWMGLLEAAESASDSRSGTLASGYAEYTITVREDTIAIDTLYYPNPSLATFKETAAQKPQTPSSITLSIYPNPFNTATQITYSIAEEVPVQLAVYDATGKLVRTLASGDMEPGVYTVRWDGTDEAGKQVPSGVYLCRIKAGSFSQTKRVWLVK